MAEAIKRKQFLNSNPSFNGSCSTRKMSSQTYNLVQPDRFPGSIIPQPEVQRITEEELINEVRGIYAGIIMVEKKCIEIDQQTRFSSDQSPTQWQALINLHRCLLHEHHDFFLASQHPLAGPALKSLATKYSMPARISRHGIHSFLELLRKHLPISLDHTLSFIYLAYSLLSSLMEVVPTFEDTWIGCLNELARNRMAIEDIKTWVAVSRHWYNKADGGTTVLKIQSHLTIPARANIFRRIDFYFKSLASMSYPRNTIFSPPLLGGSEPQYTPFRRPSNSTIADCYLDQSNTQFPEDVTPSTSERQTGHTPEGGPNLFYSIKNIVSRALLDWVHALLIFLPQYILGETARAHSYSVRGTHRSTVNNNGAVVSALQQQLKRPKLAFFMTLSILLSYSSAHPINHGEHIGKTQNDSSKLRTDDIVLLAFTALSVPVCFLLGQTLGQPRTFGTSMVVFNITNLMTSRDPLVSSVGHWVGLGLSFTFTAIFAGLLAERFRHITRSFVHTIAFLLVVWIVNYLLNQSSGPGGSGAEQSDSSSQYLLSSVAFTLICWWKIAERSIPISPTVEVSTTGSMPIGIRN